MGKNIGTNDVEKYVKVVCKQNVRKKRNVAMIRNAMKMKLDDAEYDEKMVRKQFTYYLNEYRKVTIRGSFADEKFKSVMKNEVEIRWNLGKQKNKEKIDRLVKKYAPVDENGDIRDVIVSDEKLAAMEENVEKIVKVFGGVTVNNEEKAALKLNPEYRVYKRIDDIDLEVEIEKGCTKARYHFMGEDNNNNTNTAQNNNNNNNDENLKAFDFENKVANYANIRATDFPTVQRLYPPKPSTIRREVVMQSVKDKMLNKVREYRDKNCNEKGFVKKGNINNEVSNGIKSIKERVKEKEIVVFTTDKTGEFTVDSTTSYLEELNKHTLNDKKISRKKVKQLENKCNDHLKQFNKMFCVGAAFGHEARVGHASTATNVPAPPLYGLRKTHKPVSIPPVRPVCGANSAPNSRLGHFLSRIVNNYADCAENNTECRSSEEMRAAFSGFNKLNKQTKLKCEIISMDVKALYPSMSWEEIVKSVKWLILNTDMNVESVDWFEVGKYLAVMMTPEEVTAEGLTHVIPKRRGVRLRRITVNYLRRKRNAENWLPARRPGVRQKRKMLSLAVSYGVHTTLSCHTYKVADDMYQQMAGGSIGLELTGAVARPFMLRWDQLYKESVRKAGMNMLMYERYIDDSNQVTEVPAPGSKYDVDKKKVVIDESLIDNSEEDDERTARVLTQIANNILPGIVMENDVPSRNTDRKMAILDMKVWIEKEEGNVMFQHFEKPTASKNIMHAHSAQSITCRNSVHTQEIVRRLLNSSPFLDWKTCVAPVLTEYMLRMKQSGYPEKYRVDTLTRALRIYDKMVEDDRNGTRPIYRPKDWNIIARKKEKERKKYDWSTRGGHIAPIFVPPTPNSELAHSLKAIADSEAEAGVHFKIVETGGLSMRSVLQKSNPLQTSGCDRENCLPCSQGRGEGGNCEGCGVNYELECQMCPDGTKSVYIGESARNLYTRSKEHLGRFRSGARTSFIVKHQNSAHLGEEPDYKARVTNNTRDCLSRQVREAVLIRRSRVPVLNGKTEWHQPALYRIQHEIEQG